MPDDWVLQPRDDQTDEDVTEYAWRAGDNTALISIKLINENLTSGSSYLRFAVDEYVAEHYARRPNFLEFIDEETAEDGTIRRSYWLTLDEAADVASRPLVARWLENVGSGQLDAFFMEKAPYLVVIEIFTTTESGNRQVDRLQLILNSLRVKANAGIARGV